MPWRETLCPRLTAELSGALRALDARDAAQLEEIRVYALRQAEWVIAGQSRQSGVMMDGAQMDALLAALCGHALYSCEGQLAKGYIPLPGGHRAGVCGAMTQENGVWRMGGVSSVCIRIARSVPGASRPVRPYLLDESGAPRRVLLLGAPGCGKTTVLRDAALWLAQERGLYVAAADEREELFPAPQELRIHVISGTDKARAFEMLLRAAAPQVIVTDEIGREGDAQALLDAVRCGVGVIATAHAGSLREAALRPVLRELMQAQAFDCYVLLGRHGCVLEHRDAYGQEKKEENKRGQLGCGRDGDDWHQRDGLSAFGR